MSIVHIKVKDTTILISFDDIKTNYPIRLADRPSIVTRAFRLRDFYGEFGYDVWLDFIN